jgi:uncharacterized protein YbcI
VFLDAIAILVDITLFEYLPKTVNHTFDRNKGKLVSILKLEVVRSQIGFYSDMAISDPTPGQLERTILQQVQRLYRQRIGQRPSKAICQLFDEKLSVVLWDTISVTEQTLLELGREELVKEVRWQLHEAIKPQLKTLLEEIVGASIVTVLIDSDLSSGFSSITAILDDIPAVRNPETIPKVDPKKLAESSNQTRS